MNTLFEVNTAQCVICFRVSFYFNCSPLYVNIMTGVCVSCHTMCQPVEHHGEHRECGGAEAADPLPPRGAACGWGGLWQASGRCWGPFRSPRENSSREDSNTGDAAGGTVKAVNRQVSFQQFSRNKYCQFKITTQYITRWNYSQVTMRSIDLEDRVSSLYKVWKWLKNQNIKSSWKMS